MPDQRKRGDADMSHEQVQKEIGLVRDAIKETEMELARLQEQIRRVQRIKAKHQERLLHLKERARE